MPTLNTEALVKTALNSDLISKEDTSFVLYDLERVKEKFQALKEVFGENSLAAIAVKANPLTSILKFQAQNAVGAEAASIEEVYLALDSGIPAKDIIFDGPAKTDEELKFCVDNAIYINVDSFEELERLDQFANANGKFRAGIRLNPQVGTGKIGHTSVAEKKSKFGEPIEGNEEKLKEAFQKRKWLNGAHSHIGSQGMSMDSLVEGTAKAFHFARELEGLESFDIGGGLPVVYKDGDPEVDFYQYGKALKEKAPELFNGQYKILSEFGRAVYADTAIAVSRVEYVKGEDQMVVHLGADMFLRRVYRPEDWHHRFSLLDKDGKKARGEKQTYAVAGPLCFGGDFLHREAELPKAHVGDLFVIHDVGAYTLSMWSRHCSRSMPKVLGVEGGEIRTLKPRESRKKMFEFWS